VSLFRFVPPIEQVLTAGEPITDEIVSRLAERDRQLEDALSSAVAARQTFSRAGTPSTDESGRWYPEAGGTALRVLASLRDAGSSSTVVTVYVSGVSAGTVTLASSDHVEVAVLPVVVTGSVDGTGDYVTVATTTVGTGAASPTVQVDVI
jgi:hypothetical protein